MAFKDPKKLRHKEVTAYKIVVDATVSIPKSKWKSIITNNVKPHFISLLPTSTRSVQGFRAFRFCWRQNASSYQGVCLKFNDSVLQWWAQVSRKMKQRESWTFTGYYICFHLMFATPQGKSTSELCFKEGKLDSEMRNSLLKYLKQSFWLVFVAHLVINYRILKCFCTNSVWVLFSWKPSPCYPF